MSFFETLMSAILGMDGDLDLDGDIHSDLDTRDTGTDGGDAGPDRGSHNPEVRFGNGCDCGYTPSSCRTGPFCRWTY